MIEDTLLAYCARTLKLEHSRLGSWDAVAEEYKRPKGSLWRIANQPGYCPNWLRRNIKNAAHTSQDLFAMSRMALLRSLEERKELK